MRPGPAAPHLSARRSRGRVPLRRGLLGFAAIAFGIVALAAPLMAAQPQFWRIEGAADFLEGDTSGLSVDSEGRVKLSPASSLLHDTDAPYIWSLARDSHGVVFAGTGNDGRIFRIEDAKARVLFDAPELEVHALAVGPDGRLYAGTSPDGKVYAIDASGKAETFYDPGDKYIWALLFDRAGNLLVATGAEGKIHRVDPKGKAAVVLTSAETHITALALDARGNLYAGSSPGGIVYRVNTEGKVFVMTDSPYREVKALEAAADGSLYAAVIDGTEKQEPASRPAPSVSLTPSTPMAEVTVTETFAPFSQAAPSPSPSPRTLETPRPGTAKGAVLRILPSGEIDTLWSSSDDTPHALARAEEGVLVGTGNKGKLYEVRPDRTWSMVSTFPAEQVTALFRSPQGGVLIATSNPGKIHAHAGSPGGRGTFTSKVKDTDTVSGWGRLRWEASTPAGTEVQVQTRSGNTEAPDSTWSPWSPAYKDREGDPIASERARFLQVRATLVGKSGATPVLDSITAAYLQRNLRPEVQSVSVHPPGEIFQKPLSVTGEIEILGLEGPVGSDARPPSQARAGLPPVTAYSRRLYQRGIQTFTWKADDPNGDTLSYDVHYRAADDTRFRLLRKGLTEPVLAWDTSTVPNGRYVIRVTASDAPSNPEGLALMGDKESVPFDVDNTPPSVTAVLLVGPPPRVRAIVRDDSSLVRKAEYSVDGGRWREVHPMDGINDAREESYEIAPEGLDGPGPHVVVVRAMDLLGNAATARVEVP